MEPFEKNKIILDKDEVSNTLSSTIKNTLTKQKKPVKFTWKGLADLAISTDIGNPLSTLNIQSLLDKSKPRVTDLIEGRTKPKEKDYVDFFEDIEKSIFGAAQNIGYSFGDLVTTGIDAVADTNLVEKLDKVYEDTAIDDPETLLGTVNKVLIEFGAPGGAVLKVMNRVKKLSRAKKFKDKKITDAEIAGGTSKLVSVAKRTGYMATAFGATDFITSGARQKEQGEPLIMDLESEEGLEGQDLALARFRNKLRFGAEGTLIGGGFTLLGKPLAKIATFGAKYGLFKPTGYALQGVDYLAVRPATYLLSRVPGSTALGKGLRNASSFVIDKSLATVLTGNSLKQLPAFEKWRMFSTKSKDPVKARLKKVDDFLSGFRSLGKYTGESFQLTSTAKREIKARSRTIEKYLESLEKKAYGLAKSFEGYYNTGTTSPASKEYYLDQVLAYLKGQIKKSELPKILQQTAEDLNKEIVNTKQIFGELLPKGDLKNFILNNVKTYMRKSFSIFTNPEYMPDQKLKDGAKKFILDNVVTKNKDLREIALSLKTPKMTKTQALDAYAESIVHKILTDTKTDGVDPLKLLQQVSKNQLRSDKLIKTGEELPDAIKKLLGEENNLKSSVLQTTSHAITQTVNKQTLDKLADLGLKQGWLFKSEAAALNAAPDAQLIGNLEHLGILKTKMSKLYATADMAKAIKGAPGKLDGLLQSSAYRNMLQFKVATQFGKTVLSPATQVRNVTSASMFPLANGHIGGRASVTESIKMVMDDIFGAGKVIDETRFIKNLENKIRLGVIDENIVASELKAVLKDIRSGAKVKNLDSLLARLSESRMLKTATRIYAGGDNLWKWYGHEYVKSQMRSMYKNVDDIAKWTREITGREFDRINTFTGARKTFDEALDEAAAWQIRNTYPTYSKVPEVIKNLRKLPFGNFVSFPAEMIRTTFNILSIGLKEATSSNANLRQMGYRRLMGALVTLGGAEKAVSSLGQNLTGTTVDQIEAYKRSLSAPWDSRAAIIPVNTWKDGVGKAINFSYFSPYDVVKQPFTAALKTLEEGKVKQEDASTLAFNLMLGKDGPIQKLLDPFISEAIFFEKVSDVLPRGKIIGGRGGETKTGSKVYSVTDDGDVAFLKSLVHIIEGVQPTAITTAGKIVQGIEKDIKRGGAPVTSQDELLALFSGIRIINVDVPKAMQFKITDYNKKFKSVTTAEKFFSLENYQNRGPLVMADEFRTIQEEALKVNREFHNLLQDALKVGVPKRELLRILRKRRIPYAKAKRLLDGKNIAFTAYEGGMKSRVEAAKKEAERRGEGETINKEYFYPKKLFRDILREYRNKTLKSETDEEAAIEELKKYLEEIRGDQSAAPVTDQSTQQTSIQTPPLPASGQPIVRTAAANVNPNTNLTRTQEALLSPDEKVIASRRT